MDEVEHNTDNLPLDTEGKVTTVGEYEVLLYCTR